MGINLGEPGKCYNVVNGEMRCQHSKSTAKGDT